MSIPFHLPTVFQTIFKSQRFFPLEIRFNLLLVRFIVSSPKFCSWGLLFSWKDQLFFADTLPVFLLYFWENPVWPEGLVSLFQSDEWMSWVHLWNSLLAWASFRSKTYTELCHQEPALTLERFAFGYVLNRIFVFDIFKTYNFFSYFF